MPLVSNQILNQLDGGSDRNNQHGDQSPVKHIPTNTVETKTKPEILTSTTKFLNRSDLKLHVSFVHKPLSDSNLFAVPFKNRSYHYIHRSIPAENEETISDGKNASYNIFFHQK